MPPAPAEPVPSRVGAFIREHRTQFVALMLSVVITALVLIFRDEILALRGWGYLGVFLINVLGNATVLLPIPSLAVNFASGSVLNPWLVGLIAGVAEPIGELSGYLAGFGGGMVVEKCRYYERVKDWMSRRGFLTLFILSAIPNPVFDLAGLTAGAMRYPVWKFLLACWLGKTVKATVLALIGAGFFTVFSRWLAG